MYGIFTYIWFIFRVNVGKYTSPMDPMGKWVTGGVKKNPYLQGLTPYNSTYNDRVRAHLVGKDISSTHNDIQVQDGPRLAVISRVK